MKIGVVDCRNEGVSKYKQQIFDNIINTGFVYLQNVGFTPEMVDRIFATADRFWELPEAVKERYARPKDYQRDGNTGYVAPNVEMLNPKSKAELREAFNYRPMDHIRSDIDLEVPMFRQLLGQFSDTCMTVALEILQLLANGLGLEERFFDASHSLEHSGTTLRLLHYPKVPSDIPPHSVRCGEHSDYGTITLLFQDDVGGLEVCGKPGQFIPAVPVKNAVLVNTGDLLQRWTSDRIVAVRHRVLIPEDERLLGLERRSVAFFVHPNDDVVVQPLDGSDKYPPVTAYDYLMNKFKQSY